MIGAGGHDRERAGRTLAWCAFVLFAVVTGVLGWYARGAPSDNRIQTWLERGTSDDGLELLCERFGGDEVVLLRCDELDFQSREVRSWLEHVGPRLAKLPAISRCADPLHLPGVRLPEHEPLVTAAAQPLVRALDLVDAAGSRVDFLLAVDASATEPVRQELARAIGDIVEEGRALGLRLRAAGHPLIAAALDGEGQRVEGVFTPWLVVVACVATALALRSVLLMLLTILPAIFASVGARAALRACDWPSNLILVSVGPIVFVIVLATLMHLAVGFQERRAEGLAPKDAARRTVSAITGGVFFASITTAIGFAVFLTSSLGPVRRLGIAVAISVCVFVPFAIVVMQYMLGRLPLWIPSLRPRTGRVWTALPKFASRHRIWIGLASLLVLGAGALAPFYLRRNTDALEYFPHGTEVRENFLSIEREGGALSTLDVLVSAPARGSPELLREIVHGDLGQRLERVPGIACVFGPEDVRAQVESTAGPAAALLLGPALVTAGRTDADQSVYRWTARFAGGDAERFDDLAQRLRSAAETWRAERKLAVHVTGTMLRVLGMQRSLTGTLMSSMGWNLAAMTILFLIAVKSAREFVAAMTANLLPVAAALAGAWALGFELDPATVMVSSVVLGLAVDNTFHLLLGAGSERARSRMTSVMHAFEHVGRPATIASCALTLGFGVLALSGFTPTARFGLLTAIGVAAALFGALVVLPSMWVSEEAVPAPVRAAIDADEQAARDPAA